MPTAAGRIPSVHGGQGHQEDAWRSSFLAVGWAAAQRDGLVPAFRFAFENTKPCDAVTVEMDRRFKDGVKENVEMVRRS